MRYINRTLISCRYKLQWGAEDCYYKLDGVVQGMSNVAFSICMWMKAFLMRLVEGLCSVPAVVLRECDYLISGY